MSLGNNIKELRTRKGIKQKDLAEALNVTPQAVSRWEVDDVEPSLQTLKEMCKLFDVSLDVLMSENLEITSQDKQEVVKPEVEQLPVVGKCCKCGKLIRAGEGKQRTDRAGNVTFICDDCVKRQEAQSQVDKTKKYKKIRTHAWIITIIATCIALAFGLIGTFYEYNPAQLGENIGFTIAITLLTFTTTFCISMDNNFIGDLWLQITSWGFVKMPGVIFSLDIGGIIFLITVKVALFLLSMVLVLACVILATLLAAVLSIVVFPIAVTWAYKRPDKCNKLDF